MTIPQFIPQTVLPSANWSKTAAIRRPVLASNILFIIYENHRVLSHVKMEISQVMPIKMKPGQSGDSVGSPGAALTNQGAAQFNSPELKIAWLQGILWFETFKLLLSAWLKAKRLKRIPSFQLIKSNYESVSARHVLGSYHDDLHSNSAYTSSRTSLSVCSKSGWEVNYYEVCLPTNFPSPVTCLTLALVSAPHSSGW